jgi:acyl carrier protein
MTELSVSERVKRVMTTVLDIGVDADGLPDGTLLYSTTIQLDSLRLLHLLIALESEFGCQIDDEAVMSSQRNSTRHGTTRWPPGMRDRRGDRRFPR